MNKNLKNKEPDILKIWENAGDALKNQQQLNKGKMETLLRKMSTDYSAGIKRLLKADAVFKVILIFGFIVIAALNLTNIFVLITNLICIIIGTISIKQDRKLIEALDEFQDVQINIRNHIEKEIRFYQANIFRLPFALSISVFLFYVLGSLSYHGIQYDTIQPVEDLQDGIVPGRAAQRVGRQGTAHVGPLFARLEPRRQRGHDVGPPAQATGRRVTAGYALAKDGQVGLDSEIPLRAAQPQPESGHDLVKDQQCAEFVA